jgi:hypothetical protein
MQDIKIIRTTNEIELSKRQRAPYIITATCDCGNKIEYDYMDRYLMYPVTTRIEKEFLYCEECDMEYEINLKIDITLELVND